MDLYHSGGYYYIDDKRFLITDVAFFDDQNDQLLTTDFMYVQPQVYPWCAQGRGDSRSSVYFENIPNLGTMQKECKWLNEWHGHEKLVKVYIRSDQRDPDIDEVDVTLTITRYKNLADTSDVVEATVTWQRAGADFDANKIVQFPNADSAWEIPALVGNEELIMPQGTVPRWAMGVSLKIQAWNNHLTVAEDLELDPVIVMIYPAAPGRSP